MSSGQVQWCRILRGPKPWRVEFFWKCGQPRFEGWVTWRDHQNGGDGQVTVVFATPATPDQVLRRPGDQAEPMRKDRREKWQGMWVCSHADHRQHVMITCSADEARRLDRAV